MIEGRGAVYGSKPLQAMEIIEKVILKKHR
jgi:hypothetical protein